MVLTFCISSYMHVYLELVDGPKTCTADEYCQLQSDHIESGMMACNHCLWLFHNECVFFVQSESDPECWTCSCSKIFSEIE